LNLPVEVDFGNDNRIEWIYSAAGEKVRKTVYFSDGISVVTDYVGSFVYKDGVLDFFHTSEGRVEVDGSNFEYQYAIKDHLGNTRVLFADDGAGNAIIKQETHYYPYGLTLAGLGSTGGSDNKFLYNGKELEDEHNLYWYHYGARYYDPQVTRWFIVDPVQEYQSPYLYVANNPINRIDPDGKDAILIVFPDYKISAYGRRWSHLGHAGILLIDNETGLTKYYEYGRYDPENKGWVRKITIPNVEIGENGKPTIESLNKVLSVISEKSGHNGRIEGVYIESEKFKEMNDFALKKLKENKDPNRKTYSILSNNCGTFCVDVLGQDEQLDLPWILDPRPNSIIEEFRDEFPNVDYNPTTNTTTLGDEDENN